jgi:Leucine-rich repeat (LRR) protein
MSDFEDALANPAGVTELRFNYGGEDILDGRIAALTDLEQLQLRDVPPDAVLPEALLALPKLRHLGLSGQDDKLVMPALVARLPLTRLDVWDLDAADLPPLPTLRELEIVVKHPRTEVAILAERFGRLTRLELWGSHLESAELPDDIERFSELEELHLVSCGISELPDAFAKLTKLKIFGIRGCPLTKFPEVLTRMPWLQALHLKAELAGLPPALSQLVKLRTLDLSHALNKGAMLSSFDDSSKMKPLPRVLGELSNLETLDISCCGVVDLEVLRPLTKLRSLHVTWSHVSSLEPLAGMADLEELSLEYCQRVRDLSPLAGKAKLRVLDLDNTRPQSLDVLRTLPALAVLHIESIKTKRIDPIYDLDVELHANDEIKERYEARASLRGMPSLVELEERLGARDPATVEAALAQLAAWGVAASARDANAMLAFGIPVTDEEEEDDDGDDDDDEGDDDWDDEDDEDEEDVEGDDDGVVHAGPYLPAIDLALDRHLGQVSPVVLARVFGALFQSTGDDFHAAIRIANELVSRDHPQIDEAQCVLVEAFAKANKFYDTGHREHGHGTHDTLIDQVFPLLRGPALAKLLGWASNGHLDDEHGDSMLSLFRPALERTSGSDRATVIARLETFLDHAIEYRSTAVDQMFERLASVSKGEVGHALATLRARLETKLAAARKRDQLAKQLADSETAVAAIAEAAKLPDQELEELQGALWRASKLELPRDARRQLLLLWQRRERDDGIADALATAARSTPVDELRADLSVLAADRAKRGEILRAAVIKSLTTEDYPPGPLDMLRTLATEHDGKSRVAADSAELQEMLLGGARRFEQEKFEKGVEMLEHLARFEPQLDPDDEDDPDDDDDDAPPVKNLPGVGDLASMVASCAEGGEYEILKRFARQLHKLPIQGRPLERMLAQLVAVTIVDSDPDGYRALAPLIPPTVTWDILAYNLACKAAKDADRGNTFKYTGRALELGKSPDQFLEDADFEAFAEDPEFVALLDQHR